MAKQKTEVATADDDDLDLDYMGSRDESPDARTVSSRNRLRHKMHDEIEAFLAQGGTIREIAPHVTADPPRKPTSNYGGRPI